MVIVMRRRLVAAILIKQWFQLRRGNARLIAIGEGVYRNWVGELYVLDRLYQLNHERKCLTGSRDSEIHSVLEGTGRIRRKRRELSDRSDFVPMFVLIEPDRIFVILAGNQSFDSYQ